MFKLLIFDMDGTLVDSLRDIAVAVNYTLSLYGLPVLPLEVIESYVGTGAKTLIKKAMGDAACRFDLDEVVLKFREYYIEHCLDETRLFPGTREMLEYIAGKGIRTAVVTNKPSNITLRMLEGMDIKDYFDVILGSEDVPKIKPNPEAAELVFEKTGASPDESLMIGDSPVDMQFARNSGMKCVMVDYGGITPHEVVMNSGADWICETPGDLSNLLAKILLPR